jgi:hypothetical protein
MGLWLALILAYYELLFYVWLARARRAQRSPHA